MQFENEERAKKKIIKELECEKVSLIHIQKEQQKAMDVVSNEKDLITKRDQLKEQIKTRKNELKEKQNALRVQEKKTKEHHEALIIMEGKCKKLQTLINERKAGITTVIKAKSEEEIKSLEAEIQQIEKTQKEEKKKYKQTITTQENKISELTSQIDSLNLGISHKGQECRITTLKINEIKRQIRIGALKPNGEQNSGMSKNPEAKISKDVEQIKKDMKAERKLEEGGKVEANKEISKDQPLAPGNATTNHEIKKEQIPAAETKEEPENPSQSKY